MEFLTLVREKMKLVEMDEKLMRRSVNEGFSGGEKKRNEILQMALLEPPLRRARRDRLGPRHRRAAHRRGRRERAAAPSAMLVITHYQRLLDYIVPDRARALGGRIVRSGGKELALELEEKGYGWLEGAAAAWAARERARRRARALPRGAPRVARARGESGWLAELRAAGARRVRRRRAAEHPRRRSGATRTSRAARGASSPRSPGPAAEREAVEELAHAVFACSAFVFVDGRFAPELSSPRVPGGRVEPARRWRRARRSLFGSLADLKLHPFAALQGALAKDGAVVTVPAGAVRPQPIHLVFVRRTVGGAKRAPAPRVVVAAERGSRALVVQDHVSLGDGPRFADAVTEVAVGAGAAVHWSCSSARATSPSTWATCRRGSSATAASPRAR